MAEYGRAVATPDILFEDEVYINDHRVHWIDYKDYAGTRIDFLYKSNVNQAERYGRRWGPGALCYRWGYLESLSIPMALPLDARALPIKFQKV